MAEKKAEKKIERKVERKAEKKAGKKLTPRAVSAEYWRNREQFADFFNAVLYGGRQIISPNELEDADTDESSVFEHREYKESLEQSRDSIKTWKNVVELALLGIEGQENIHYGMPLRIMGYDYLAYKKQYDDRAESYREKGSLKGGSEFLSGMKRTDKLLPVITVVIYYGQEPWDGAKSLHGMLSIPEGLSGYVNDYKICVVEARKGSLKFKNKNNKDLFELLGIVLDGRITKSEAKNEAIRYGREHEVDKAVVKAVTGITNSNIDYGIFEKEDVSMYTVFDAEREEGRKEGREEGKKEGREEGIKNIIYILREMNIEEEKIFEQIMKRYGLDMDEAKDYLKSM